jgi:[glutamine synthetase] adenylyltransferase / [glutamine synthetase]-adenylyl-L-tyrosine phosphorylase
VPFNDEAAIEEQIRQIIGAPSNFEEFLDRTRDAARQMRFVTGARLLSDILSPAQAGEAYAAIAAAIIRASFEQVRQAFEAEHGVVPGAQIAIVGLGRLGSRELTAGSDLDLVIIYDFDEEKRESAGPRKLDVVVYHTRLTQRLVAALTVPTRRGLLYEVDLRLRPQGGKGPVASQFRGFVNYQQSEADLWEHMALTRARVIAGDVAFGVRVENASADILAAPRDPKLVFKEVMAMRELIAQEKGDDDPWDLKLARGGLTDLDFIAQGLKLAYPKEIATGPGASTPEVIAQARDAGLIAESDSRILLDAHHALSDVFQWQRLMVEGPFDAANLSKAILKRLAAVAGLPTAAAMQTHLTQLRDEVARISNGIMK